MAVVVMTPKEKFRLAKFVKGLTAKAWANFYTLAKDRALAEKFLDRFTPGEYTACLKIAMKSKDLCADANRKMPKAFRQPEPKPWSGSRKQDTNVF